MTKDAPSYPWASPKDHIKTAKVFWGYGLNNVEVLALFKGELVDERFTFESKYVFKGKRFRASEIAQLIKIILEVSDGLKNGKLKATKAKGLFVA